MKKRILSGLVSFCLLMSLLPLQAYAKASVTYTEQNGVRTGISSITIDPYTYYDVGSGNLTAASTFQKNLITRYLINDWADLAVRIYASQPEIAWHDYSTPSGQDPFKYNFGTEPAADDGTYLERLDVSRWLKNPSWAEKGSIGTRDDCVFTTGLSTAVSLKQIREAVGANVAKAIGGKTTAAEVLEHSGPEGGKALEKLDSETQTNAIYTIVTALDHIKGTTQNNYNAFGIAFYDFDLTVIADDDLEYVTAAEAFRNEDNPLEAAQSSGVPGVTYKSNGQGDKAVSYTDNFSGEDAEMSMTFGQELSSTVSNAIETSETYSFTQMIGSETQFSSPLKGIAPGIQETLKLEFTAGETFSTAYTEEKSVTKSTHNEVTSTITVPAHTAIGMAQQDGSTQVTLDYDCPVAINFKVAIFSLNGIVSDNNISQSWNVSGYDFGCFEAIFGAGSAAGGASAPENLYFRALQNAGDEGVEHAFGNTDGWHWEVGSGHSETTSAVNWKSVAAEAEMLRRMATRIPMASSGATISMESKSVNTSIYAITPMYLLKTVRLVQGKKSYDMTVGSCLQLGSLEVEGLDSGNVPCYGFDPDDGSWVVCDESGVPLADGAAVIETDPLTGESALKAEEEGTVYLRWMLHDGVTYTAKNETGTATNDSIDTAYIKISISSLPFTGSAIIRGTYTGIVNDPAQLITEGLTAMVMDEEGKEVPRPVTWDAKELSGITLNPNGQVFFTKPGTYHVRAIATDTVKSDWYAIEVLPERVLTQIRFRAPAFTQDMVTLRNYYDQLSFDLNSYLSFFDQYGDAWTGATPQPAFSLPEGTRGASITGGILTVTEAGSYTVSAAAEGFVIPDILISVGDIRPVVTAVTPASTVMEDEGGSVTFTLTGRHLEDGIVLKTDTGLSAVTSGTDTEQTATLVFPANPDPNYDNVYPVFYVLPNRSPVECAAVTVEKASGVLRFETNGGLPLPEQKVVNGTTVDLQKYTPVRKGYTFLGWYLDKELRQKAEPLVITEDTVIYAAWHWNNPFRDVTEANWFYGDVEYQFTHDLMKGINADTFSPQLPVTRGMFVTMLWRYEGEPKGADGISFTDVSPEAYYYDAIVWASGTGTIMGYDAVSFGPKDNITREQLACILYRYAAYKKYDTSAKADLTGFGDRSEISGWAETAMQWAVANGLMQGRGTELDPRGTATRAEAAAMFHRFLVTF